MTKTTTVGTIVTGIIIFAAAIAAFELLPHSLTGYDLLPMPVDLNLSVESVYEGRIEYLVYQPQEDIEQYTTRINISTEFFNSGSVSYSTRIGVLIQDFNGSTNLSKMYGGNNFVPPGGRISFATKYTPITWGWQWIHVIVPYGANNSLKAEAWALIYVKPYYYPWPPVPPNDTGGGGGGGGGGSGGGGGGGGGGITYIAVPGEEYELITSPESLADTGVVGFNISYPKRVSLTPGGSSVAYIIANNTGTMTLRNIMVTGYSTGAKMDINPKMVYKLPGKNATIFMITFDAPDDVIPGTYVFDFKVLSNRANRSGRINLDIGELAIDDSLNQTILNYQYIVNRMEEEVWVLKLLGRNMTLASGYLDESKYLLKQARKDYNGKAYDAVQDKLKRVKRLLILAAAEIALARSAGALIALSPASFLLYILIVAAIITGIALYIHKKRKEKQVNEKEAELSAVAGNM